MNLENIAEFLPVYTGKLYLKIKVSYKETIYLIVVYTHLLLAIL